MEQFGEFILLENLETLQQFLISSSVASAWGMLAISS